MIRFGNNGIFGEMADNDLLEMKAFCEREISLWQHIPNRVNDDSVRLLANNQIDKWAALYLILNDRIAADIALQYLAGLVKVFGDDLELVSAKSPFANRILRIVGEGEEITWPKVHDHNEIVERTSAFRAGLIAMRALIDKPDPREFHVQMTARSAEELSQKLSRLEQRLDQVDKTTGAAKDEISRAHLEAQQALAKQQQEIEQSLSFASTHATSSLVEKGAAFERSATEYSALLDAAKNKDVLERPVTRWRIQEKFHARNAANRIKLAAALALLTIVGTPSLVLFLLDRSWRYFPFEYLGLPRLVFSGVSGLMLLTFGLWATRIAIRSYMAEEHLKNDCANRVGITDAFIKLQSTMGASEEEKKILLNTIMRPAQDGIVHDDGLPNGHPASLLVQLLDPKRAAGS